MLSQMVFWLILVSFWIQMLDVRAFNLQISPERSRVKQDERTWVTITCSADTALSDCQFSWWAEKATPGPVLQMAAGPRAQVNRTLLDAAVLDYQYAGRGLEKGDCGLRMQVHGKKLWTVGCRARAETGGWKYAWMDLIAYATDPLANVVVEQSTVVVFPGQDLNLMCSTTQPVDSCFFSVPGIPGWLDFAKGLSSRDSKGRHVCRGRGAAAGQCGLSLHKVVDEDNGPVRCYMWKSPKFADNRAIHVIVAKPPAAPRLEVSYDDNLLNATCSVSGSRPVVDVRWVLGENVLRNDADDDAQAAPEDEWKWPWSRTDVTQHFSRTLTATDYGKTLKCVVSHVTLEHPIELAQRISKPAVNEKLRVTSETSTGTPRNREATGSTPVCDAMASCRQEQGEYCSLRLKEARHAAAAALLAEEANRVTLEAARAAARAEDARARAEESRAREEAAWEKNAAEELLLDQERRTTSLRELRKTRSTR